MAQRSHREPSDEWEMVAANEVHIVDALKQEGNILFQQKRFFEAIDVYARALAHIPPTDATRLAPDDIDSLGQLEVAVRLNRALAYIELHDMNLLAYAEEDCSIALMKQPHSVKAFYRRALARERLGKIKDALSDIEQMCALEPANPAALHQMARLQEAWRSERTQLGAGENELSVALKQQCSFSTQAFAEKPKVTISDQTSVCDAWTALQAEETRLRGEFLKQSTPTYQIKARLTINKVNRTNRMHTDVPSHDDVRTKTDSLWASLVEEETSTIERFYRKKPTGTARKTTMSKPTTNSAASIHPSR